MNFVSISFVNYIIFLDIIINWPVINFATTYFSTQKKQLNCLCKLEKNYFLTETQIPNYLHKRMNKYHFISSN